MRALTREAKFVPFGKVRADPFFKSLLRTAAKT
jgi:hypothetical protein